MYLNEFCVKMLKQTILAFAYLMFLGVKSETTTTLSPFGKAFDQAGSQLDSALNTGGALQNALKSIGLSLWTSTTAGSKVMRRLSGYRIRPIGCNSRFRLRWWSGCLELIRRPPLRCRPQVLQSRLKNRARRPSPKVISARADMGITWSSSIPLKGAAKILDNYYKLLMIKN